MKRWLVIALKFTFSAILIVYLFYAVDLEQLTSQIAKASPDLLVISTLILSLQYIVAAFRWHAILVALNATMSFGRTLQVTFIGAFFNQALPSSAGGDAVRIYKAYKHGLLLRSSVNSVMLERLATVLGLMVLVVICQPFFIDRTDGIVRSWMFPALATVGILGTAGLMALDFLPLSWRTWRVVSGFASLAKDTRSVFLRPGHALPVLAMGLAGHLNISLGVWVLGLALGLGGYVSLVDCFVLIPLVLLVTTIPISIAGWGVREAAMVTAFQTIGVSSEHALLLSLVFGIQLIVISLPGGLVWALSSDLKSENLRLADQGEMDPN